MLSTLLVAAEEVTAKNPMVPETKEIVWAVISFAIVFGLLAWKAWPAIKKAIADREDHIKADLERAAKLRYGEIPELEKAVTNLAADLRLLQDDQRMTSPDRGLVVQIALAGTAEKIRDGHSAILEEKLRGVGAKIKR